MGFMLSEVDLNNARLSFAKGVCGSCRERRAWEKPDNAIMPSVALPGNFNEEAECDLIFTINNARSPI